MIDLAIECLEIVNLRLWRVAKQLAIIVVGTGLYFKMHWATVVFTDVVYWLAHQEQHRIQPIFDQVLRLSTTWATRGDSPHP